MRLTSSHLEKIVIPEKYLKGSNDFVYVDTYLTGALQ